MGDWHPRPAAQIGLRLLGGLLIASLGPQGHWLRDIVHQSSLISPAQCLLAASCFLSASLGVLLLLMGPDLWKPVAVTRQWHGHAVKAERDVGKSPRTANDACSSPMDRPGSQRHRSLERYDNAVLTL